jgi:PAS domain S-box-containing protein
MLTRTGSFLFRKPRFVWYEWSAAIAFCGLLYAVGIFFEYNMPKGTINRIAGLLEFTAIIGLVHCFYGFTFSYLGIKGQRYHTIAGTFHALVLVFLWFDNSIVADEFVTRNFIGLARPYVEPALGPLGPAFMIYAALASIGAMIVWITHKRHVPRYRTLYLAGAAFWLVLGVHDGLAALGVPTVQYMMEYGFFGYSVIVLWTVFNRYVMMSTEDKYRAITEMANDCILVVQSGKAVFANQACNLLIGRPVMDSVTEDLLNYVVPEDRQRLVRYYNESTSLKTAGELLTIRIDVPAHKERTVEIRVSEMRYRNKPANLFIIRDVTERVREEEALRRSEERLSRLRKMESLGTLAGGVAHDLNNVLSAIVSYRT